MAVWLPLALVAAAAFHCGFGAGGWPFIATGFGALIAAFAGHVIINVTLGTLFTPREVALGLIVYCAGLFAFGLATLASPALRASALPVSLGFLGTATVVIATMVIWLGLRGAFDSFDVIRRFKP
jgi:hypothetical protein